MTGWRWVSMVAFAGFAWIAVGFVPAARAEEASKDTSGTKSSDSGKQTAAKLKKHRKPTREGERDDKGQIARD